MNCCTSIATKEKEQEPATECTTIRLRGRLRRGIKGVSDGVSNKEVGSISTTIGFQDVSLILLRVARDDVFIRQL